MIILVIFILWMNNNRQNRDLSLTLTMIIEDN